MIQQDSFSVDGGYVVCAISGSVWPVLGCFCMGNDKNTRSKSSLDVQSIESVWLNEIQTSTMK